jgi:hypothetical protein
MRCLPKFNFLFFLFLQWSQFDWSITQKSKKKLWRLHKTEGSILKHRVPFLWGLFGNSLGNISGTWELFDLNHPRNFKKKKKSLHGKSTGHVVHSPHQTQLERKKPPLPPHTRKNGGPFTP